MTRALIRHAPDAACLALLVLITVGMGHAILTTALSLPETMAEADARKGM
jgi:hypothetical protein